MTKYPECEKLAKVSDDSQKIGEFVDWLNSTGRVIAFIPKSEEKRFEPRLVPVGIRIEELLAEYFQIDLNKVEKERRQMLDEIRKNQ